MSDGHDKATAVFIISLLGVRGIGPKTVMGFLDAESPRIAAAERLDADFVETLSTMGTSKAVNTVLHALKRSEATWEELESEAYETLELAEERGVYVLHPLMDSYPRRLLKNGNHPPILYCKGDLHSINPEKSVAIVGTRHPTEFGRKMGRRLAQLLAEDGYVVVSGLAVGCDAAGHEGALDVGGRTVAVLPTPVDGPVYPRQNQNLADRIVDGGGALVSEYAPGMELNNRQLVSNLVARDEWQPALSDGVVAIETSVDGGTRHAVEHAFRTGTPVAVFDYRSSDRLCAAFETDHRFSGNMHYLTSGRELSPIYGPETVDAFKARMNAYRQATDNHEGTSSGGSGQQMLLLDSDC